MQATLGSVVASIEFNTVQYIFIFPIHTGTFKSIALEGSCVIWNIRATLLFLVKEGVHMKE